MSGWFHSGQDITRRCSKISGKSKMLFTNIQLILDPLIFGKLCGRRLQLFERYSASGTEKKF